MLGRTAYQDPYRLAEIDSALTGAPLPSRHDVVERMLPFIEERLKQGAPLKAINAPYAGIVSGAAGCPTLAAHLVGRCSPPGIRP